MDLFLDLHFSLEITIAIGICSVAVLFFIISYAISKNRDAFYEKNILSQSNTVRTFFIDFNNNRVTYFNLNKIRSVRVMDLDSFYGQYPESNFSKVNKWLQAVMDEKINAPDTLETLLLLKSTSKPAYVLLKVDKVDYINKTAHLSSYLLKNSVESSSFAEKRKVITSKSFVTKELNKQRKPNGFTLTFKFSYNSASQADEEIDPLLFGSFKNFFFDFLTKSRYLLENDGNSLTLVDLDCKAAEFTANTIASSIVNGINKNLSLNGKQGEISIYIGGADHSTLAKNKENILKESMNYAEYAQAENIPEKVVWYVLGKRIKHFDFTKAYRTEVERIISSNKLKNKFRLIYNVEKMSYFAYLCKTQVNDQFFEDFEELKEYSLKTGDSNELMANIIKNSLPRFMIQRPKPDVSLFFPCMVEEKGALLTSLSRINNLSNIHLTILFSEDDVLKKLSETTEAEFESDLRFLKTKGFNVSLSLCEDGLKLSNNIYSIFDSFVVNFSAGSSGVSIDNEIRASLHMLVEKLIKYKKPIICNDLEGWDAIELLVRSGLSYICSESLSPYSEMVLRIDPKIVRKIQNMKG